MSRDKSKCGGKIAGKRRGAGFRGVRDECRRVEKSGRARKRRRDGRRREEQNIEWVNVGSRARLLDDYFRRMSREISTRARVYKSHSRKQEIIINNKRHKLKQMTKYKRGQKLAFKTASHLRAREASSVLYRADSEKTCVSKLRYDISSSLKPLYIFKREKESNIAKLFSSIVFQRRNTRVKAEVFSRLLLRNFRNFRERRPWKRRSLNTIRGGD